MTVTLLDRTDEAAWLAQRRNFVTATDIAKLANGGPAQWALVKADKLGTAPAFTGNRYTDWGKTREPFIVASLELLYDVAPNDQLAVKDGTQWAGTPDAIGGTLLGEVKTTTKDWPVDPHLLPQNYQDQMLWCQGVFDLPSTAFAWEVNENFTPGAFRHLLFPHDADRYTILEDTARRFLDFLNDEQPLGDWDGLTAEASILKARLDAVQAEYDELLETIRERAGDSDLAVKTPFGSISLAYPKARDSFDSTAFKAAHPALYSEFVKTIAPSKRTLRFTPQKEATR